jgi:ferredoxin
LNEKISLDVPRGSELLKISEKYPTLPLKFGCKRGECGVCLIDIHSGAHFLTKCSPQELNTLKKNKAGLNCRLACQCALNGDIEIA